MGDVSCISSNYVVAYPASNEELEVIEQKCEDLIFLLIWSCNMYVPSDHVECKFKYQNFSKCFVKEFRDESSKKKMKKLYL
jgi:hypothetical protein